MTRVDCKFLGLRCRGQAGDIKIDESVARKVSLRLRYSAVYDTQEGTLFLKSAKPFISVIIAKYEVKYDPVNEPKEFQTTNLVFNF